MPSCWHREVCRTWANTNLQLPVHCPHQSSKTKRAELVYSDSWWQLLKQRSACGWKQLPSGFWTPLSYWRCGQQSLCHGNWLRELVSLPLRRHLQRVSSQRGLKIHVCVHFRERNRSFPLSKSPPPTSFNLWSAFQVVDIPPISLTAHKLSKPHTVAVTLTLQLLKRLP